VLFQIIFVSLALCAIAPGVAALDAVVSEVIAQPSDVKQQERILELLPTYFNQPGELSGLLDHLRYDVFDTTHCRLLTRTALRLEREYDLNPKMSIFPLHVRRSDLHGWITYRIKQLVLPDVGAFDDPNNGKMATNLSPVDDLQEVGLRSDFWTRLLSWADEQNINSIAMNEIRAEIEAFRRESKAKAPAVNKAGVLPDELGPSIDPKVTNPKRDVEPTAASKPQTSFRPWTVATLWMLAAIGLSWLLLKKQD
jgi:hypothetical protein